MFSILLFSICSLVFAFLNPTRWQTTVEWSQAHRRLYRIDRCHSKVRHYTDLFSCGPFLLAVLSNASFISKTALFNTLRLPEQTVRLFLDVIPITFYLEKNCWKCEKIAYVYLFNGGHLGFTHVLSLNWLWKCIPHEIKHTHENIACHKFASIANA